MPDTKTGSREQGIVVAAKACSAFAHGGGGFRRLDVSHACGRAAYGRLRTSASFSEWTAGCCKIRLVRKWSTHQPEAA